MKINFNRLTSIILNKYCNKSPNWFNDLIFEFHNHYDLDSDDSEVIGFMSSQTGTKTFVDWLKNSGYDAEYWEFQYYHEKCTTPVAFGINIKDTCEKFIELKLKQ